MALDVEPLDATSTGQHYYEDGLQPIDIPDGLHVDSSSPYKVEDHPFYPPYQEHKEVYSPPGKGVYASELPTTRPGRIWALKRRTFWILFAVIAIVIVGAAVGGSVGGSLSKNSSQSSAAAPSSSSSSGSRTTVVIVINPSSTFTSILPLSTSTTSSAPAATGTSKPGYCSNNVPHWLPQGVIADGIGLDGYGVRFADLNGDGRVEYLYVGNDGSVIAYLNLGAPNPSDETNAGKVDWASQGVITSGFGGTRDQTHFADIDGDGKADYLLVLDDGSVKAWLNTGGPDNGADAAKVGWMSQGQIATSGMGEDGANVMFADIDGDGKADYLWLDPDSGNVTAFLNTGPLTPGNRSVALLVGWKPLGIIASGFTVGNGTEALASARFADMNGDGRPDYCELSYVNGNVTVWQNEAAAAGNISWTPLGVIAAGVQDNGQTVQFGDLNGDGRWDYLDVDDTTGAITAWINGC